MRDRTNNTCKGAKVYLNSDAGSVVSSVEFLDDGATARGALAGEAHPTSQTLAKVSSETAPKNHVYMVDKIRVDVHNHGRASGGCGPHQQE